MTNPIDRRLDRLETEVQKRTDPGRGPVFKLIDNPYDPVNPKRLEEARQFLPRLSNRDDNTARHCVPAEREAESGGCLKQRAGTVASSL